MGKAKLGYQTHRGIDGAYGVITASEVGRGDENEAHRLGGLIDASHWVVGKQAGVVVADTKYGTRENYLACHRRGVVADIAPLRRVGVQSGRRRRIFAESAFIYDGQRDVYRCPGGEELRRRNHRVGRQAYEYVGLARVCRGCQLRSVRVR